MKQIRNAALVTTLGLGLGVSGAMAQSYSTGDLVLGIRATAGGVANDLLFNLGSFTQYDAGAYGGSTTPFTPTGWSPSYLSSTFSAGPSSVSWGVFGAIQGAAQTANGQSYAAASLWASAPGPNSPAWQVMTRNAQGLVSTEVATLGNEFNVNTHISSSASQVPESDSASYTSIQTAGAPGTLATTFQGDIEQVGPGVLDLYELANPQINNGNDALLLGSFILGADDSLTFVPVPEASTFGLIAAAGLLALSLRRQLSGKNA